MNESDRTKGWQGHGPDSIEERRRILRSIGAGGAVAGLPTLAHASGRPYCKKDGKNYHATASAVGSMVGSVVGTTPPKWGYGCSHYQSSGSWSTGWTNGQTGGLLRSLTWNNCGNNSATNPLPLADRLLFWVAFGYSSAPGTSTDARRKYCSDIIQNSPTSNEGVWLAALLNANKVASGFAYTRAGVIDLHHGRNPLTGGSMDSTLSAKALILFRDYLSAGPV